MTERMPPLARIKTNKQPTTQWRFSIVVMQKKRMMKTAAPNSRIECTCGGVEMHGYVCLSNRQSATGVLLGGVVWCEALKL